MAGNETKAPAKDSWFTIDGIKKETKRIRWPKWKTEGSNPGIGQNTGEVLTFVGFFAVYFVLCEFVVTFILRFIGIGA